MASSTAARISSREAGDSSGDHDSDMCVCSSWVIVSSYLTCCGCIRFAAAPRPVQLLAVVLTAAPWSPSALRRR